ncbi:glycoside hydrolase family 16 protein [Athelia psychrophila]|uniref:Glycoside hydrolase family 16 protein n=1 Tax=Athelia psychrophila TaxID=1759441 RepID=A0A166HY83_9AGAM|nr:glycoside hydrolase family 16 protein [Fibularhizoctonia sp. CBS 109695]
MPLVTASAERTTHDLYYGPGHRLVHKRLAANGTCKTRSSAGASSSAIASPSSSASGSHSTSPSSINPSGSASASHSSSASSSRSSSGSATKSASATSSAPSSTSSSSSKYKLADLHEGSTFFDEWNFFTGADPTHGNVNFVSQASASKAGLAVVQSDNTAIIAVDSTSKVAAGGSRNSVRISSKKLYSSGLFIADFSHMPQGCGTWPAWWSAGPNWPSAGEIDIIEGVNDQANNQYTLHSGTGSTCTLSRTPAAAEAFTSNVLGTTCLSNDASNSGCGFSDPSPTSFGPGFNAAGGGVFAHLWDSTGIKIWRFARSAIPADVTSRTPNPSGWGTPAAAWGGGDCDIQSHFFDHALTLDTTVCGDWAGDAYAQSGCPGTCAQMMANATNFKEANWGVKSIAIYQL